MIHPGDRVGHIRIDGRLGEGGMGTVFVGFDEKLQREVVLKAIRSDRGDPASRSRFLVEARLLSQLDHPNICRIHGYLENDPNDFLVLERIHGRTLRTALEEGIKPGARLAIAEAVARALEAAHAKGIIHRDLKPENVMLTAGGVVKVLDFGLARPAAGSGDWSALQADAVQAVPPPAGAFRWRRSLYAVDPQAPLLGTPASMSPEQARGEPATAASDAYALGLLLQELFTGRPPYEEGLSEPLLLVKAGEGDTLPLAGVRDPDLAHLIQRLKALAPEARPTAAAAADSLAWIRGKPGRRHRRLLAAAVAAAFLLVGVKYTLDLREEQRQAQEARRAAEQEALRADATARFLEALFKAADPRQSRGHLPDARELLHRGTERLKSDRELADQPLLRARLLDTLGDIDTTLGLYDEARPLLEETLAIRLRLRGPGHAEVAESLVRLGTLAQLSGKGDAVALFRRALAIFEARLGPDRPEVADVLNRLGTTLAARGRLDEAEKVLRRSLALSQRLWGAGDLRVAKVLHNLSGIAYYRGRTEEGERLLRRALAIREAVLPDDHPDLAGSREALALLLRQRKKTAEATALLERVAATAEKVYGPEHAELAKTLLNLGLARADLGQDAIARRLFERALAIDEKALEPTHPQRVRAREVLATHCREVRLSDAESGELCRKHGL